jgi:hypothetical protein
MAVTLNASTSSGFIATSDTSGVLELQNNGTTRMTVNSSGVSFAAQPLINGVAPPAFSAVSNATQILTNNVETTVSLQTEVFDTANAFNNSTYAFQPTIAGYYQFSWFVYGGGSVNSQAVVTRINRNDGFSIYGSWLFMASGYNDSAASGSGLMYLNGSTDYAFLTVRVVGSGTISINAFAPARLTGFLARAA